MPAIYTHRRSSEQIAGGGRNTRKMSDAEKTLEGKIFGIDVDGSTFRKYNHQSYTIGFHLTDLRGVEFWATNAEVAATHPETVAEAKQIMKQIIAEITGKEEQNMKEPRTAADFIAALQDIYNESRAAYDSANANVEKAKALMDNAYETAKGARGVDEAVANAKYEVARGEYKLAEYELRNEYKRMVAAHDKRVSNLREQFAAFLNDHYAASPDKLDSATMALLNSGICTPSELSRLIERHKDNPTMLRIVGNHARKMREEKKGSLSYEDQIICSTVANAGHAAKDGSRELALYDSAVSAAAYGLGEDYGHATRMHSHVVGWLNDFKTQIVNLPLTPAVDAPEAGGDE